MALTGELVELSNFNAIENSPQGLASSGTRLFLLAMTRGYEVNTTKTPWTIATFTRANYANADNTLNNQNIRAATYRNGKILAVGFSPNKVLLEIHPDTGEPTSLGAIPNTVSGAQGIAYNPTDEKLYVLDAATDALWKITIAGPNNPNTAERIGQATQFGDWAERIPRGLTWYRNQLVGIGLTTRKLAIINTTDGTAKPQGISTATVENNPFGLVTHAGDLILVGGQHDKIYRCRDVRWDAAIPDITLDARETETLDLSTVSQDAETYAFKTGYTPPNWITRNGAVLTINAPDINTDRTETLELTASRTVSGTPFSEDTEITVRVRAATAPPIKVPGTDAASKTFSYQGHPIALTAKIHNQDVTSDLASVDDIGQGIDYPNLTEFRVGEASFTLRDIHGDFSPNNPSNFFTRNGGRRTGRNSPIEIEAGFIVDGTPHTETVFKGTIIRIVQDATGATVKVVCTDNFGDMRKKTIADFGIPRHFMLTEALEQTAENGAYPIMDAMLPASDGSVSLATRVGETIQPVQKLQTEGTLNPRNFIIDREGVRTEGGLIVNRGIGYPQIRMKSPYRYRHSKDIITDILTHAGIEHSEIEIPAQDVDSHFSSNGRVNYDLIGNIGSSNPVTWNGYVTDFLHDADNDKWYFLYNKHRANPNGFSQVITYDTRTRTYTKLHGFRSATEVWKFTKSGNSLYILASTGGNYDANEASSENQIIQLDITGPTETVFVAHTVSLKPQLSHYYAGVGSIFMKPDSRRQLIYHQNALHYAFVDRANRTCGIAKATAQNTTTAVITINQDNHGNHAGITFSIDTNGILKGGTTFVSGGKSQILGFKKAL